MFRDGTKVHHLKDLGLWGLTFGKAGKCGVMGLIAQEFHDVGLGFPELEGVMLWAIGKRGMGFGAEEFRNVGFGSVFLNVYHHPPTSQAPKLYR